MRKRPLYWAAIWLSMMEPWHLHDWTVSIVWLSTVEWGSPVPRSRVSATDSGNQPQKTSGSLSDKWAAAGWLGRRGVKGGDWMGFTVAKDGGGSSLAEAKQQALSFRRAARELDLTLREGLFLPTQLHFDIGTFGFRIRTTFLSPPTWISSNQSAESLSVEGVSAFCCPLLTIVRFRMGPFCLVSLCNWLVRGPFWLGHSFVGSPSSHPHPQDKHFEFINVNNY